MSRRSSLLVLPGYLAAALLFTWPLAPEANRAVPTGSGLPDAHLQAFLLEWDLHAWSTRPGSLFDVPIFHPEKNTLTYMDHLLGEAAVAAPVAAAGGNLALAYNVVVWFSFVASAWATYRLTRMLGISRGGGFMCGLLFAFSPYRFGNMANLNLLQTQFIPLGLFFALRFARAGRTRDLFAIGATLAAQSYFSWYHTFHLVAALATLAAYRVLAGGASVRWVREARWPTAMLTTALLMTPGVLPYLRQRLAMPDFIRSLSSAAHWSADVLDYLAVNPENRALGGVSALSGDQPYSPGLVAMVLAAVAVAGRLHSRRGAVAAPSALSILGRLRAKARTWGDAGFFLALGAAGFILSLGPLLRVAGHRLWIPLPYALLFYAVPGFASMRAPGRFAVLLLLAITVLAGMGYELVRRRWALTPARNAGLFTATLAVTVALSWSVPWPTVALPRRDDLPPVYRWLMARPGGEPVLDLPVPAREADEGTRELTRQFYAVYHRKPLVDGASGFVSLRHRAFRAAMQDFPAPRTIRAAAERGARLVIVHYGDWPDSARARIRRGVEREPALRPLVTFGDDAVYQLESE